MMKERSEDVKIWTESGLAPVMDVLEYILVACQEYDGTDGETLTRLNHWIQSGAPELEDQTIYGFRIRDLVPLASVLRAKGVSPKEIEDWHKDLQGLLDFVAEQEMEAHQKAVADVLKGFKGPDEETGEWFMKAIGSKGEEG